MKSSNMWKSVKIVPRDPEVRLRGNSRRTRSLKARLPESIRFQPGKATYFLGSETYGVGKKATLIDRIRLSLFAVMARNASPATAYFQLPPGRVVELGAQITL